MLFFCTLYIATSQFQALLFMKTKDAFFSSATTSKKSKKRLLGFILIQSKKGKERHHLVRMEKG